MPLPQSECQRHPDLGSRCDLGTRDDLVGPVQCQRHPDLGSRCDFYRVNFWDRIQGCQRHPDLGSRCDGQGPIGWPLTLSANVIRISAVDATHRGKGDSTRWLSANVIRISAVDATPALQLAVIAESLEHVSRTFRTRRR